MIIFQTTGFIASVAALVIVALWQLNHDEQEITNN